jgi:tetratricopeptide (TPR) repeat protein
MGRTHRTALPFLLASAIACVCAFLWPEGTATPRSTAEIPPVGQATVLDPPVRSTVVDLQPAEPNDDTLEELVLHERYVEAFSHAVEQLQTDAARLGPMHPATLLALHRVGTVAFLANDLRTAEETLEAALTARTRTLGADDARVAETAIRRGMTARFKQDRATARRNYDEARRILDSQPGYEALRGALDQAEGDWIRGVNPAAPIDGYRTALERRRRALSAPSFPLADNLTWLGWGLARTGQREEAVPLLREARAQLDALGVADHTLRGTIDNLLADVALANGRTDESEELYRSTARIFERGRAKSPTGFLRWPFEGLEMLALLAVREGRGEEAWSLLERSRGATLVDFVTLGSWRLFEPDTFLRYQQLRDELLALKRTLGAAAGQP